MKGAPWGVRPGQRSTYKAFNTRATWLSSSLQGTAPGVGTQEQSACAFLQAFISVHVLFQNRELLMGTQCTLHSTPHTSGHTGGAYKGPKCVQEHPTPRCPDTYVVISSTPHPWFRVLGGRDWAVVGQHTPLPVLWAVPNPGAEWASDLQGHTHVPLLAFSLPLSGDTSQGRVENQPKYLVWINSFHLEIALQILNFTWLYGNRKK